MSPVLARGLFAVAGLGLAALAATLLRAARRSFDRYRVERRLPPLHYLDDSALLSIRPRKLPRHWPAPDTVSGQRRAFYALLANEHADLCEFLGELVLLIGGAGAGATINTLRSTGGTYLFAGAVLLGGGGVFLRGNTAKTWRHTAGVYERPIPPPAPRRLRRVPRPPVPP